MGWSRRPQLISPYELIDLAPEAQKIIQAVHIKSLEFDLRNIVSLNSAFCVTAANLCQYAWANDLPNPKFVLSDDCTLELADFRIWPSALLKKSIHFTDDHIECFDLVNFISCEEIVVRDFISWCNEYFSYRIATKRERFEHVLTELMENVFVHSECPWGGYLYGHFNTTKRLLQFSIADFGTGIPRTVINRISAWSDLGHDTLVYEASKIGVSSQTDRVGLGLAYVADCISRFDGALCIFSQRGCLSADRSNKCLLETEAEYPGTLITIELPLK